MCYSSRATKTVVFWFLLLLASLAICHHFQGCSIPMTVEKQRHKVDNCCLYMVFTCFHRFHKIHTMFYRYFTAILPSYFSTFQPSGLGHRRSRGAVDLPGPRRGLGAGLRLCHAALEQSRGWEVGRARGVHGMGIGPLGLDDVTMMLILKF